MPPDLFISPHLDDAVLSCGEMLARLGTPSADPPKVATVFAGFPPAEFGVSAHDEKCGFAASADAVAARRAEDDDAGRCLGYEPVWGPLPDAGYRDGPADPAAIAAFLWPLIAAANAVFVPLGLSHPDHVQTSDVAWGLCWSRAWQRPPVRDRYPIVYEELPYRVEAPILTMDRLDARHLRDRADLDVPPRGDLDRKRAAVGAYRSQLPSLDLNNTFVPERFWRLRRPTNSWATLDEEQM